MPNPYRFGRLLVLLMILLSSLLVESSLGNLIFWMSFCVVGQPIAVLLYAIDYEFQKETGEKVSHFQDEHCRIRLWGRCLLGEG